MKVLIIPEDVKKDQYILKPIITAMMEELGKPYAKVDVCQDPRLRGISQATRWEYIQGIVERYGGMYDLLLLCVDRDSEVDRRDQLNNIEQQARSMLNADSLFLAENAWQEVEVWLLAGHTLPAGWNWSEIREERDPKERYYLPFAEQRGVLDKPGDGRKTLGKEAARRYDRIRRRCPEDIVALEQRIHAWIMG
ncbi:MAG: hypothetical protein ACLFVO_10885 [Chloroflexaceae bacterium]